MTKSTSNHFKSFHYLWPACAGILALLNEAATYGSHYKFSRRQDAND